MSKLRVVNTVFACLLLLFSLNVDAAALFFVESNVFNTVDTSRDLAFQSAVGNLFIELDLDEFANGTQIDTLTAGSITIDVGLNNPAVGTSEIFTGSYPSGGGSYGTVSGSALLNRGTGTASAREMTFDFSTPVGGFGAWIFDDLGPGSAETSFTLTVTETGGAMSTSTSLSAGNAGGFFVEGFLAVTSDVGIESVVITSSTAGDFFEVDHLQIATVVPIPAAAWLFGSALFGLGVLKRKKA